jgi:hypothetical protein
MLPEFTSTEKAILFGQTATPQDEILLVERRNKLKEISSILANRNDFDSAIAYATRAQFDREALEAYHTK